MTQVTVLVCVHNDEATIATALESALDQTAPRADYEVLVVDDGSDDATPDVLEPFRSRAVEVVRVEHNRGLVPACNEGLSRVSTPFFVRLDGDDGFEPGLIASLLAAADERGANVVTTDRWDVSAVGRAHRLLPSEVTVSELVAAGVLLPTGLVRELGGYRELFWEEYDLYLRLLESGRARFAHVPEPLYQYTVGTAGQLTSDVEAVERGWNELRALWGDAVLARYGLHGGGSDGRSLAEPRYQPD